MTNTKIGMVQFWDSPVVPDEIMTLIVGWKSDPAFDHTRFDLHGADAFIEAAFDAQTLHAFRQCAIPAMQADFFRYCYLYEKGGVYVDADTKNGGGLAEMIAPAGRGTLMDRQTRIANDFLFVRAPRDPLYEKVIAQAVRNIENRISNNVWQVTGPGIMTHMYHATATRPDFDGFTIKSVVEVRKIVQFQNDLDYKSSQDDWRTNLSKGAPSIFRDI